MKKLYYMTALLVLFGALSAAVAQMGLTTQPGMMRSLVSTFSGSRDFPGGSSDYVTVDDDASLQFGTGDFALSIWHKPDTTSSGGSSSRKLFDKGIFSLIYFQNTYSAYVGNGGYPASYIGGASAPTGSWTHLVLTRTSGTLKLYYNGVNTYTKTNTYSVTNTSDLVIGGDLGSGSLEIDGPTMDARIYNTGLSESDVTNLYTNKRASTVTSGLVLHLPLNDGPEYLTDQSGEGNDGTTAGTLTASALEP